MDSQLATCLVLKLLYSYIQLLTTITMDIHLARRRAEALVAINHYLQLINVAQTEIAKIDAKRRGRLPRRRRLIQVGFIDTHYDSR